MLPRSKFKNYGYRDGLAAAPPSRIGSAIEKVPIVQVDNYLLQYQARRSIAWLHVCSQCQFYGKCKYNEHSCTSKSEVVTAFHMREQLISSRWDLTTVHDSSTIVSPNILSVSSVYREYLSITSSSGPKQPDTRDP